MTKPRDLAGSVNPDSIQGTWLENGAVTSSKLADGAVTQDKIDNSVSLPLADGAVTSNKIGAGAIDNSKVSEVAAIASSKLDFTQGGTNAVSRTAQAKLRDIINVRDFGAVGDGTTSDSTAFQAAVDYAASLGGGTVYVPEGDYPIALSITTSNIELLCDPGTVLRAASGANVITIGGQARNITIDGADVRGQTLEQEQTPLPSPVPSNYVNTRAVIGIRIEGADVKVLNTRTSGCRLDGIYIRSLTYPSNILFEDCYFDASARMCVTLISGTHIVWSRCTMRQQRIYYSTTDSVTQGGYLIFDAEPNQVTERNANLTFRDIEFICDSNKSGSAQIVFHETNVDSEERFYTLFERCNFTQGPNGSLAAFVRLALPATTTFRNFTFRDCYAGTFLLYSTSAQASVVSECVFENITLASTALFLSVTAGRNCSFSNIQSVTGNDVSITGILGSGAAVSNVGGLGYFKTSPQELVYTREINVTDTSSWTNLLRVNFRGAYKITIGGSDASNGSYGMHYSETICVASNDTVTNTVPNVLLNVAGLGLDVQWATSGTGTTDSHRTLQIRPQNSASNQWVVKVEALTTTINQKVTWFI